VSADANKSELTLRITEAAAVWLDNIGAKPVETEVPIDRGWVADLAGAWCPTRTEAQMQGLIPRSVRFSGENWDRHEQRREEREKAFDALPAPITIAHEVKVSRGDFRGDKKWDRPWPANMCVLSIPDGMLKPEEYPAGWWILLHSTKAGTLRKVERRGEIRAVADSDRMWFIHQVGLRCDHRVRNQRWRDLQKSHRNTENENVNRERMHRLARVMVDIVNARFASIDETLGYHLRRPDISSWLRDELTPLYGLARRNAEAAP